MGLVSFLIAVAVVSAIASAVLGVILVFNPPKPGKVTFGYGDATGPRYGFGPLDNTVSNELAIPVLYGQLKVAGNVIWQTDPDVTVSRIVGICEGQIESISDIRANDVVISEANTPGSSVTAYRGTNGQAADSRVPEPFRQSLDLKRLAYVALTLTASDNLKGGNPAITSVCEGLLVSVWRDGVWTTAKEYSRNPAACLRDFLINQRYGLGILESTLDDDTFGSAYEYCEAQVDGPSGKEVRYRLDYVVDAQRPAQDILNDMLATFNAFIVYAGNKVKLRIEKDENVTQYFGDGSTSKANGTFDPNNIVKDSFSWQMPSIDDRPNRIRVQWVDPDQNYVKIYTQVEDRIDQDERNTVITKDIALLGITRQSQASRMAKLMMATAKYAAVMVSFSARLESIMCEVGDVVAVTHQASRFTRRLFRIVSMQEAENESIRFTCKDYVPSIYDDHLAAAIVTYRQPSGPNLYGPLDDVTGLTLLEDNFKQKDGVFATNILASWTPPAADQVLRLDRYLIQLSTDGGTTYRDVAFVSGQKAAYKIVLGNVQTGTTFSVRVKTVSDRGAESGGTAAVITIQGKSTPPSNVEDFDVVFAFDRIAMSWSAINDEDLFAYEIRQGDANSTWETAGIIATEILTNHYDLFDFTTGSKKFFVKAIDNSQNYSEVAAEDSILITSIPESNVVFTFDMWSRVTQVPHPLEGTLSSDMDRVPTNDFNPAYNRIAFQPKTAQTWADLQSTYATWQAFQGSSFIFGREEYVTTPQTWETTSIDVSTLTTGAFLLDFQGYSSSNLGFIGIEIATSSDNVTFTAYRPFTSGQYRRVILSFGSRSKRPMRPRRCDWRRHT